MISKIVLAWQLFSGSLVPWRARLLHRIAIVAVVAAQPTCGTSVIAGARTDTSSGSCGRRCTDNRTGRRSRHAAPGPPDRTRHDRNCRPAHDCNGTGNHPTLPGKATPYSYGTTGTSTGPRLPACAEGAALAATAAAAIKANAFLMGMPRGRGGEINPSSPT